MDKVYLAGPIKGLTYGEAADWRKTAAEWLWRRGIGVLSPMRYKEYLSDVGPLGDNYANHPTSSGKGIYRRDHFDVSRCDVVLMNLEGAERVSIGTMIEAGQADMCDKPVVLVMERGNCHEHAILENIAGFIVPTLAEGLIVVAALLDTEGSHE
jgi:nucleoside 2-deoxyribosyltransferase